MRRLLPLDAVGPLTVDEAASAHRPRRHGRPWVMACMIASVDGSITLDGRSGGLGTPTDAAMLAALRRAAEVVVVGAGTVRAEGYGPPKTPGQRIGVVTNTGSVDVSTELFRSGAGFLIAPRHVRVSDVEVLVAGEDRVDLRAALAQLDAQVVQAEGGATLNAALVEADLIDEWNTTISPMVVGGEGPRLVQGASERARPVRLAQLVEDDSMLFARWLRVGGAG